MQAFAPSSNFLVASSPSCAAQRRRSNLSRSPLTTNIEMPRLHETAGTQWNIPATYIMNGSEMALYDPISELRLGQFFQVEHQLTSKTEVEHQVQDHELDRNGIVPSDVYSRYCKHGHDDLLKRVGISTDTVARAGEAITFSDLSLRLFAPLKGGDKFVVRTSVACISAREIFIEDAIYKLPNYELVLEANATAAWLDGNSHRMRILPGLRAKLLQLDFLDEHE